MAKPVHHQLDIYQTQLHLAWTPKQWQKMRTLIDSLDPDDEHTNASGFASADEFEPHDPGPCDQHVTIWINHAWHHDVTSLVRTVAHEAVHAASFILGRHGHTIHTEDEPHAYLVDWIAGWIWDQLPPLGKGART